MTLRRDSDQPLLDRDQIPDVPPAIIDATSVFNPGACSPEDGRPMLLLRVQTRGRRTFFMRAFGCGRRGAACEVEPRLVEVTGLERLGGEVHHVYDPRITRCDGQWYVLCAIDLDRGCRVGIFTTTDFARLDLLAVTGDRDARNGVLFPEQVGGKFLLLERPNTVRPDGGALSGDVVELRASTNLTDWTTVGPVMRGRPHYWDELIGAGPPPLKTEFGWLLIYHGVASHLGTGIYQAGAALLDLDDPTQVLARTRDNILEPRTQWELAGQVPNVVFPSGTIQEPPRDDGTYSPDCVVSVIYGAADTCVGVASATVAELVEACRRG